MGTWSAGITGNDTAQDLYTEYTAAFYKYDVDTALEKIEHYVRTEMFDESDGEEWCAYCYSLADFMWKKGILTERVRSRALEMIDSGFGLELWEAEGKKALESRKKKLREFREKLVSPMPPKKKIKPDVYLERIFEDGDIVAVQLQTAGKTYSQERDWPLTDEEFHGYDGKYVLMQLVNCSASWTSAIVPEVKDHWACFRLFDGVYDTVPEKLDPESLREATIHEGHRLSPYFSCESSLFYFKKRNYRVLCNRKDLLPEAEPRSTCHIFWKINRPWMNPDSIILAAMNIDIHCGEYTGGPARLAEICRLANRYGRYDARLPGNWDDRRFSAEKELTEKRIRAHYMGGEAPELLSKEENEAIFLKEEEQIGENIRAALAAGGKLLCCTLGTEIGIVTVEKTRVDNIYMEGRYQQKGFGAQLLSYALTWAGDGAYIDVPRNHRALLKICQRLGLMREDTGGACIRMKKP